jgi:hypothetical protein
MYIVRKNEIKMKSSGGLQDYRILYWEIYDKLDTGSSQLIASHFYKQELAHICCLALMKHEQEQKDLKDRLSSMSLAIENGCARKIPLPPSGRVKFPKDVWKSEFLSVVNPCKLCGNMAQSGKYTHSQRFWMNCSNLDCRQNVNFACLDVAFEGVVNQWNDLNPIKQVGPSPLAKVAQTIETFEAIDNAHYKMIANSAPHSNRCYKCQLLFTDGLGADSGNGMCIACLEQK